jgi:hypothetical protein
MMLLDATASRKQERSHPVTIFLNDRAVYVAAKKNGTKFAE